MFLSPSFFPPILLSPFLDIQDRRCCLSSFSSRFLLREMLLLFQFSSVFTLSFEKKKTSDPSFLSSFGVYQGRQHEWQRGEAKVVGQGCTVERRTKGIGINYCSIRTPLRFHNPLCSGFSIPHLPLHPLLCVQNSCCEENIVISWLLSKTTRSNYSQSKIRVNCDNFTKREMICSNRYCSRVKPCPIMPCWAN